MKEYLPYVPKIVNLSRSIETKFEEIFPKISFDATELIAEYQKKSGLTKADIYEYLTKLDSVELIFFVPEGAEKMYVMDGKTGWASIKYPSLIFRSEIDYKDNWDNYTDQILDYGNIREFK